MEFLKVTKTDGDRISINLERIAYATIFPQNLNIHFDKELSLSISGNEVTAEEYERIQMAMGFIREAGYIRIDKADKDN